MTQVTIREAKTHLSRLIQLALDGEDVLIAKGKQPPVRLTVQAFNAQFRHHGVQVLW